MVPGGQVGRVDRCPINRCVSASRFSVRSRAMSPDGSPFPPPTGPPAGQAVLERANPWWKQWYTFVGASVVVLLVTAAVFIAGGGSDDDGAPPVGEVSSIPVPPSDTVAPSDTGSRDVPATAVEATTAPPSAPVPSTGVRSCRYAGTDDFGDMQVEVEFANVVGSARTLEVTYTLVDQGDVRFLTRSHFVELPRPGERFRMMTDTLEGLPADVDEEQIACEILDITDAGIGSEAVVTAGESDGCRFVEIDDFGDVQIELTLTSQFASITDIVITYALRGPDDVRFGTGSTLAELIGAGETLRLTEDTLTEAPGWAREEVSCAILGLEPTDL